MRSAAELLAGILSESGEEIEQLRAENGEERVKRIDRFLSECGALSVSDVLRRLKNNRYQVGFSEAGGENAVRVMTMHASKGLEFPVVIVAGMDNRFDDRDFKEKILTDEEWGFAPLSYNEQNFTAYDTILRALFRERMTARRAEDEMRLLYVAATRAQYCMHFIFREEGEFDFARVGRASKFSDFIPFEKFRDRFLQLESADFVATGERPAPYLFHRRGSRTRDRLALPRALSVRKQPRNSRQEFRKRHFKAAGRALLRGKRTIPRGYGRLEDGQGNGHRLSRLFRTGELFRAARTGRRNAYSPSLKRRAPNLRQN